MSECVQKLYIITGLNLSGKSTLKKYCKNAGFGQLVPVCYNVIASRYRLSGDEYIDIEDYKMDDNDIILKRDENLDIKNSAFLHGFKKIKDSTYNDTYFIVIPLEWAKKGLISHFRDYDVQTLLLWPNYIDHFNILMDNSINIEDLLNLTTLVKNNYIELGIMKEKFSTVTGSQYELMDMNEHTENIFTVVTVKYSELRFLDIIEYMKKDISYYKLEFHINMENNNEKIYNL